MMKTGWTASMTMTILKHRVASRLLKEMDGVRRSFYADRSG